GGNGEELGLRENALRVLAILSTRVAMKQGTSTLAVKLNHLIAQEHGEALATNQNGRDEPHEPNRSPKGIIGQSSAIREVFESIARVAQSQATVMLRGESGTGKELVATAIHQGGPRAERPFVRLHC